MGYHLPCLHERGGGGGGSFRDILNMTSFITDALVTCVRPQKNRMHDYHYKR